MAMGLSRMLMTTLIAALLASSSSLTISARKLELESKWKVLEEGGSCWDALLELQSCSTEVAMFFLNGEAHLGANCCGAIRVIEHQCWPSMLSTMGITAEETDLLRGYCHAAVAPPPSASTFPRLRN